MRANPHGCRSIERGVIVPTGEIEIYLANGWRLSDEPDCLGARLVREVGVNKRFRIKKMRAERARKNCCDEKIDIPGARRTQGR